jgi:hypothetical protein
LGLLNGYGGLLFYLITNNSIRFIPVDKACAAPSST